METALLTLDTLAKYLKEQKKKVLTVSADVYRPAAIEPDERVVVARAVAPLPGHWCPAPSAPAGYPTPAARRPPRQKSRVSLESMPLSWS